jgi:hypothetical protein
MFGKSMVFQRNSHPDLHSQRVNQGINRSRPQAGQATHGKSFLIWASPRQKRTVRESVGTGGLRHHFLCSCHLSLSPLTDSALPLIGSFIVPFRLNLAYIRPSFPHMVCVASPGFLFGILFNPKDEGNMFFQTQKIIIAVRMSDSV